MRGELLGKVRPQPHRHELGFYSDDVRGRHVVVALEHYADEEGVIVVAHLAAQGWSVLAALASRAMTLGTRADVVLLAERDVLRRRRQEFDRRLRRPARHCSRGEDQGSEGNARVERPLIANLDVPGEGPRERLPGVLAILLARAGSLSCHFPASELNVVLDSKSSKTLFDSS